MNDRPRSRLQYSLGTVLAMPLVLALFLGLSLWGGWELGLMVLPLAVAYAALRRGATTPETLTITLVVYLLLGLLIGFF
jgi:hypothetical protein